jgi:hypothetical protein
MISEAEKASGAQPVHREILGEIEEKRSYRRSTLVLALPRMKKMIRKIRGLMHDGDVDAQRGAASPLHLLLPNHLQQARGTKTGDWIGYSHGLALKDPARYRNSQCRVSQMPDFHK